MKMKQYIFIVMNFIVDQMRDGVDSDDMSVNFVRNHLIKLECFVKKNIYKFHFLYKFDPHKRQNE